MNIHLIVIIILIIISSIISFKVIVWEGFSKKGLLSKTPQSFIENPKKYKNISLLFTFVVPIYDILFYYHSPISLLLFYVVWLWGIIPFLSQKVFEKMFDKEWKEMEEEFGDENG